ncbi:sugar phosphate permease [Murinocardiopsis flavida]|uniref:Sugar phosphate permease n=1 Tax=Murinocardiopsis flavida TaxID=645275 RepID=A0A2P8DUD4_9ACTN|nr:MFS transporter [Murinocardiopsis flavida]PSL00829.1 sugar phosphate permease [Murinocardiopsis flavida]
MIVRNRWFILGLAMVAQIASLASLFGVPFLLAELRSGYALSTAQAGTLSGLPNLGLLCTLLGWGLVIDRYGERFTMVVSLVLTACSLALLGVVGGAVGAGAVLVLVGAVAGPVNAASGRLVLGLFHARERGLAMGVRQTGQPLGMALAAAVLPTAGQQWGFAGAMLLPAALALAVAPLVALFATAPERAGGGAAPRAAGSPYRHGAIWRIHGVSMLLGVPQVAMLTYALVYLVDAHGWSAPLAGAVIALGQLPGALARLLAGVWSDRRGDRLGPVRIIAAVSGTSLLLLAAATLVLPPLAVVLLLACLVLSLSHNGLTFTAAAETAGMAWAGRAMAAQNSLQAVSSLFAPVLMGAVLTWQGYPAVFAVSALFCAAAVALVPPRRGAT